MAILETMDYFFIEKIFISKTDCESLSKVYFDNEKQATLTNHHASIKELDIDTSLVTSIDSTLRKRIKWYLEKFNTLTEGFYSLSHATIREYLEGKFDPLHHDSEYVWEGKSDHPARHFVCSIFLTDGYTNGEVCFPNQGLSVVPETGKLLIHPASYMFPYMNVPSMGGRKLVLRLTYYFDKIAKAKIQGYETEESKNENF